MKHPSFKMIKLTGPYHFAFDLDFEDLNAEWCGWRQWEVVSLSGALAS